MVLSVASNWCDLPMNRTRIYSNGYGNDNNFESLAKWYGKAVGYVEGLHGTSSLKVKWMSRV